MTPDPADKLRRRITTAAARGVARGSDARQATFRAARRLAGGWVPAECLPSPIEVHDAAARRLIPGGTVGDRLERIAAAVGVLERVRADPAGEPQDDLLDHALRVFSLVHAERPFDEELLTAALVQDVGMAIDRGDPVAHGIEALGDLITRRTRWLVEMLPAARAYDERTLGQRARQRLESHPDFLDILLLAEAGRRARGAGRGGLDLDEAIRILRDLDADDAVDADDEPRRGAGE